MSKKISVTITDSQKEELDEIQELCGLSNVSQLLREALSLYKMVVKYADQANLTEIVVRHPDTRKGKTLHIPRISNIKSK